MPFSRFVRFCLYLVSGTALLPGLVFSQAPVREYPTKPITLIVPYAPGNTDILARIYLQEISRNTDWAFTYDYKPGAAGRIGTALAAKAAPDGHTMLLVAASVTYGHLMKSKLSYDWRKDLAPVFLLNRTPGILLVYPSLPIHSLTEYIAYARANPGKINYATVGTGGIVHLIATLMHSQMGVKVTYVPYKGYGPIAGALASGEVHAAHPPFLAFQANVAAGKIRPLALTAANARLRQLPGVRSMAEEGLPDFDNFSWVGIFVPGGTPTSIVSRLNGEFTRASRSEDMVRRLEDLGETIGGGTAEEFKRFLYATSDRLGKVIKDTGFDLEE